MLNYNVVWVQRSVLKKDDEIKFCLIKLEPDANITRTSYTCQKIKGINTQIIKYSWSLENKLSPLRMCQICQDRSSTIEILNNKLVYKRFWDVFSSSSHLKISPLNSIVLYKNYLPTEWGK